MTNDTWSREDAELGFDEVVRRALAGGPQRISLGDEGAVVVIRAEDYDRLAAAEMVAFFRASPLADAIAAGELTLERSAEESRDIAL